MMKNIQPNTDRIRRDIEALAEIIDPNAGGYTRISFSDEDRRARKYLREVMETEADFEVRIDAAANLIGYRAGQRDAPCIMVGSHLDTVPGGGRFDGIAGVIAGLEVARRFREENIVLQHSLEVVDFLAEEPSPFGLSTIGSRGMAGKLNSEKLLSITDNTGRTLFDAIGEMGGDPGNIDKARRSCRDILLNLELHIEQGPQLYNQGIDIGIVSGIVGIYRGNIEVSGRMDHAGTTPMSIRSDALTAAAEVTLCLEMICRQFADLVGTTGTFEIYPNAANVIPSRVTLGMEVRCQESSKLQATVAEFKSCVDRISRERRIEIKADIRPSSNPVIFDQKIKETLAVACKHSKISCLELTSGASHDASHIAEFAPTGMIFIPSREGRSHCPQEWSEFEHVGRGVVVLANAIQMVDEKQQND